VQHKGCNKSMLILGQDDRVRELRAIACANLYTNQEMAAALGVSVRTIYRLAERGLPVVKIGGQRWINPKAASAWLAKHCVSSVVRAAA
jgi:excisionase family DNA binding protein